MAQLKPGGAQQALYPDGSPWERLQKVATLIEEELDFAKRYKKSDPERFRAYRNRRGQIVREMYRDDVHARVAQSALSPYGFYERLVTFWADHFSVSKYVNNNLMPGIVGAYEAGAIRPYVTGDFASLLKSAVLHPAMLYYLDQNRSVGPNSKNGQRNDTGLNENLAREILELHTLGVGGGYTQIDVREFAKILTGTRSRNVDLETRFFPGMAEPGAETVMGKTYGVEVVGIENVHEVLDDLAQRPETAQHLSRKLAIHFIGDHPSSELIARMTQAYLASRGNLIALYDVLLHWPGSWADFGSKVKTPYEFIVSTARAFAAEHTFFDPLPPKEADKASGTMNMKMDSASARRRNNAYTVGSLVRLNQPIWDAPGPDGWPEQAEYWITAQSLVERNRLARRLYARRFNNTSPDELMETALGDAVSANTRNIVVGTQDPVDARTIVLVSPEFNRR